jgi:hypothetical protein
MLPKMIHGSMVNNLIEKFQKNTLNMIMSPLSLIKEGRGICLCRL